MSKYMVIFSALCILLLGMEGKGIVNVAPLTNATGNIFETNIKPSTPNFRSWTPITAPDTYADRVTHATVYDPVEDKIYMIGGSPAGGAGTELALCQQYDPVTNTWSDKASMITARGWIKGDYVRGKIYVIGGLSNSSTALNNNEEYTISSNTWATKTAILGARLATIEDVWRDSLIYVMGGWDGVSTSGYTDVEIYNPFTNTWATGSALPMNGDMGSCAIVGDTIYITNAVNRSGSAYWPNIYKGGINPANPTSITWSPGPVPPILSSGTGTAAIGDNIYWIVGTTCFKYNRTTGVISTVDPYPIATCRCNFLVSRPSAYELYGIAGDANGNSSTPNNYYYKNTFPPLQSNDVGMYAIRAPGTTASINVPITPIGVVKNYGTYSASFPVVCSIIGSGTTRYTTFSSVYNLLPGDTARVVFASYTPTISEVESVIMRTMLANDSNHANDRMSRACGIYSYYQDFEANNGGFIADPATGAWTWGPPSAGPSSAYSGTNCWGTGAYNPNADWNLNSCRYIALINNPLIGFMHWYQIESYYDGANVKCSTNDTNWILLHPFIDPYNGVFPQPAFESCWTGTSVGNFWHPAAVIIPVNAGQIFWVRWHFHSDASVQYAGWYVDDVVGIGCVPFSGIEEVNTNNITITALNLAKPNPVINGIAHISFSLAEPSQTSLRIFDASGRLIKTLVNSHLKQGIYNYSWNCRDDNSREVARGIYFCTLETPKQNYTKKLVLIK